MFAKQKVAGNNQAAYKNYNQNYYNKNRIKFTQNFDRDLLPTSASYYSKQFPKMRIKSEWVRVCCPFHEDHEPSLNINMVSGDFRCWACGVKGCDVLAFQRLRYKQTFKQAAIALGAWRSV